MDNEQTKKIDTPGNKTDKALAPDGKPISDYDKALELVKRREEATKAENETLDRKEKLAANSMLGGDTGGHVAPTEPKEETPKEYNERIEKEINEGKHND